MNDDIQYAIEHGIIDAARISAEVEMAKRKELLKKHPYKVWQAKNGRWCTYFYNRDGTRVLVTRKDREDLYDWIVEYVKEQEDNPTVSEIFRAWLNWKLELNKISKSTYNRYEYVFSRSYDEFGKRNIKNLSPEDFRDFMEEQIPRFNLTAKGFSNLKTVTKGLLKYAKRHHYIDWNYTYMLDDIEVSDRDFKKNLKEDYEEVYSDEEMKLIIDYLVSNLDQTNMGLLLVFITGLRVGELSTLKPENIEDDCITVRRTETKWKDQDGKWHIEVKEFPKSEAGWRTVVVPSEWKWLLKRLKMLNPWGEWIFTRVSGRFKGKRMDVKTFEYRLTLINKRLGIYHKSPHKIRKTYCTILMDEGMDDNFVTQQMGHTSILVSENHYHRNRKSIDEKQKKLDGISDLNLRLNSTRCNHSAI